MATEERLEQLERSLQQAGSALQVANYRISSLESSWYDNFGGLDGGHACVREPLYLCWRRSVVEELELRHVVFLGNNLAGTTCIDGKGTNQCGRHAERTLHSSGAGVEQTTVPHAQSQYERGSAEETAEKA